MEKRIFGKLSDGRQASAYRIINSKGMSADILDYGAILLGLNVPFKDGSFKDVVTGYDDIASYEENSCFFGATIAPCGNRIADALITIDGVKYELEVNDGPNNLHSHYSKGAHKRLWSVEQAADSSIKLSLCLKDGELGFPGNISLSVTYELTEDNGLCISYEGKSDKNTCLNPTNHSYFNLCGHGAGSVLDHSLKLNASAFTEVGAGSIPTGNLPSVKGTVFDFTSHRRVGADIDAKDPQLEITSGYDHNFAIDGYKEGELKEIAELKSPDGACTMTVLSTLPGVQFYAGNFITDQKGKGGVSYKRRCALCLETQFFPDSLNHKEFPSPVFGPQRPYKSCTIYKFS